MMHFRQDIFEAAGVEVPEGQWTWEQTRELCQAGSGLHRIRKATRRLVGALASSTREHDGWCDDLFRNFGADIWDETGTQIILADESSEQAVRALNFIKEAWDTGLFPEDAASWDFASNNTNYQEEQGILVINAASIYVWCRGEQTRIGRSHRSCAQTSRLPRHDQRQSALHPCLEQGSQKSRPRRWT